MKKSTKIIIASVVSILVIIIAVLCFIVFSDKRIICNECEKKFSEEQIKTIFFPGMKEEVKLCTNCYEEYFGSNGKDDNDGGGNTTTTTTTTTNNHGSPNNPDNKPHEHTESDWIVEIAATKTESGKQYTKCTECGERMNEKIIPATGSVGLEYSVNYDEETCTITGIGTCTDNDVIIPEYIDGYYVTHIDDRAFYNCTSINKITIPASIEFIGSQVFYKASNLTTVCLNGSKIYFEEDFLKQAHITKVIFNGSEIPSEILYGCENITDVVIGESVYKVGSYAFYRCTSIENVYFNNSLAVWFNMFKYANTNPLKSGANLYINNTLLTHVDIPDTVTEIGAELRNCISIKSVNIPKNVKSISSYAFESCTSLTSITLQDRVSEIGYAAFMNCSSLKEIVLPDSVTYIGSYAFAGCSSLTKITIPDSLETIGDSAFRDCTSLKDVYYVGDFACWFDIEFGYSYANPLNMGANLYVNNELLTNLVIPEGVEYIDDSFQGCPSITTVTIPSSVTDIPDYAFYGCTFLTTVNIPNTVTKIGTSAFENCTSLVKINYNGTIEQWHNETDTSWWGSWDYNTGNYTIYCIDGTISK